MYHIVHCHTCGACADTVVPLHVTLVALLIPFCLQSTSTHAQAQHVTTVHSYLATLKLAVLQQVEGEGMVVMVPRSPYRVTLDGAVQSMFNIAESLFLGLPADMSGRVGTTGSRSCHLSTSWMSASCSLCMPSTLWEQ